MKRIYFFQPNFAIGFGEFKTYWLPYGVARLWSYAKSFPFISDHWYSDDFQFERVPIPEVLATLEDPAIAAFSCYIWNWNYNLAVAKAIKEKWPKCKIILGGPQVPERIDRINQFYVDNPYVDFTVHGEAEQTFVDLLQYIRVGGELPTGVTVKGSNAITSARVKDLDALISPFMSGVLDSVLDKHPGKNFSVTLETNRGCPFQCTFCDWGSLTFNKVKCFSTDLVKQEIEWISRRGIKFVDVADANFGIFKERDFELLKHMVGMRAQYGLPEIYSFNWNKNSTQLTIDMVQYLTDHKMARGFTLSVQSMDEGVLTNIKRRNMEISKFSDILAQCNAKNLQTYSELILGLPGETKETWKQGISNLLTNGQHNNIEVWLCQMLENAELNGNDAIQEYHITTAPIHNYISGDQSEDYMEGIHVIRETGSLPHDHLLDSYMFSWMITNFHSFGWTQIYSRWENITKGTPFLEFYEDFLSYILVTPFFRDMYYEVRSNLTNAFETGMMKGRGLHYYISEFQKKLHMDRATTLRLVTEFAQSRGHDSELIDFSNRFVTDVDVPHTVTATYSKPIWEIINGMEHNGVGSYQFDWTEPTKSTAEYFDSFYFRRRKGWGKSRITML